MNERPPSKPEPHPGVAAMAIAGMALIVAAALALLGPVAVFDRLVNRWADALGLEGPARGLPAWLPWLWTALVTMGLCQVLLHVAGHWRRVVVFVSLLLITLAWCPVLALASFRIPLGAALVAVLWGGIGSMVYAARHREPN
jgi:hypothetical protein